LVIAAGRCYIVLLASTASAGKKATTTAAENDSIEIKLSRSASS